MNNPTYRRHSRYEITARKNGVEFTIGYTARKSRAGLLDVLQANGTDLIEKLSIGPDDMMTFGTKPRAHATVAGWWVGFTGRTQWEATQQPLPPVAFVGAAIADAFGMRTLPNTVVIEARAT